MLPGTEKAGNACELKFVDRPVSSTSLIFTVHPSPTLAFLVSIVVKP